MTDAEMDDGDLPEPSLKNIIDQKTLQWVFVGGKGGVGKVRWHWNMTVVVAGGFRDMMMVMRPLSYIYRSLTRVYLICTLFPLGVTPPPWSLFASNT